MKELEKILSRLEATEQRALTAEARVKQLEAQVAASGALVPVIGQQSQALPPPLPLPTNASSPVAIVGLAGGGVGGAGAGAAGAAGTTGGVARGEVSAPATFYGLLDQVEDSSLRAKTRERCDTCSCVCMCVCVCVRARVYVCMYVCMYVCTYVRTHVGMHVCMYVCM